MGVTRAKGTREAESRWCGASSVAGVDPWTAGARAAEQALDGREAQLLVAFAPPRLSCPDLLAGIADASRDTPTVGCTAETLICADGIGDDRLVVLALGGEGFNTRTASFGGSDPRAAGHALGRGLVPSAGSPGVAMLLTAAGLGDQNDVLRGAYGVLGGGVPLVGGCTGVYPGSATSDQFDGRTLITNGGAGAWLGSDGPISIGVEHGFRAIGEPMVVTRSKHGVIYELQGKPALEVYLEHTGAPAGLANDPAAFQCFALAHPLVMNRRNDLLQARCIVGRDLRLGALECIANVPQGAVVHWAKSDRRATLAAARAACEQAIGGLDGRRPRALLVFDCVGRRAMLGEGGQCEELEILRDAAEGAPIAGFYSLGEIARRHGISGFHNQAIVVVALA